MAQRLGWASLSGKKLLDFGCGVRFARTIMNLGIEVDLYAGIDINKEAIDWLKINCPAPRFRFEHLNVQNPMYSPGGKRLDEYPLFASLAGIDFDVACMFSVITHQVPDDARKILSFLHRTMGTGGRLYFTAFLDEETDTYREAAPDQIAAMSTYNPDYLCRIVAESGWTTERIYARTRFQQQTFVARKA
jgi:SAM-dependent methyltransferase